MSTYSHDISTYQQQLETGFRLLRFPSSLEIEYRDLHRANNKVRQWASIAIGLITLISLIPIDVQDMPERIKGLYYLIRVAVAIPLLVMVFSFHFIPSMIRFIQPASVMAILWIGVGNVVLDVASAHVSFNFAYEGVFIVIMISLFMAGLRFQIACVGPIIIVLSTWVATQYFLPESRHTSLKLFYITAISFCGMVGAYTIEYQFRKSFIQHAIVQHMAIKDGLTGLFNRSEAMNKLSFLLDYARREQKPITLLLADVDHFKLYNDHYGHLKGDECLRLIGQALQGCCKRPLDFAARMGGEEFLMVWFDSSTEDEGNLSQQVHQAISALAIPHDASKTDPLVTLSAGFSTSIPTHDNTINQLINAVDEALYHAKNTGRNRTAVAS
ncbi:hypothetical protein A9Q99_16785 [Gammaproteobacteria bacterium 45_16_T64]|nr:hypothetical protein A9Q99_16785 [Gammaproteobacteria bacterium 45_16_T64]